MSDIDGVHNHACTLCEAGCGLTIAVTDGTVTLIRGDRDDVASHGYLCPKGTALKELQYDPDRLTQPMLGEAGEFQPTDATAAFTRIESLLRPIIDEHGPDSVAIVIGNPAVHRTGIVLYLLDLIAALGSRNVFSSASLDQIPKQVAVGMMFGDFYSLPVPDIDRSDLLVIIGANPVVSNGSMWTVPDAKGRLRALRARGGRLVVIDPRRTETAELADVHLAPKPGTDVFLLAAMAYTIIEEGLVDLGAAGEHLNGFDAVAAAVGGPDCSPESVAARCGIDAAVIRQLARDLCAAPAAAVYGRMGTTTQRHGTVTSWLIDVLNIISGNLDRPGGAMFPRPPAFAGNTSGEPGRGSGVAIGRYHSRVSGAPEVMGQFPMGCLAEEVLTPGPGQIRALITIGANPALSTPDSAGMQRALASLDALVSFDIYVNETTRHADVIIPGPSPLEDAHYDVFFSQYSIRNTARFSPPALPSPAGTIDDDEAMLRLIAVVSGLGASADIDALDDQLTAQLLAGVPEEFRPAILAAVAPRRRSLRRVDLALRAGPYGDGFGTNPDGLTLTALEHAPSGIDLGPLTPRLPEVLRTPTGRIELAPDALLDALRNAIAEPVAEADLTLIGRRHLRSNNSWMHNLRVLTKGAERCTLLIHPTDAAGVGLADGDMAEVTSSTGRLTAPVEIDDGMRPGVVSLPHGWGHDLTNTQLRVATERPGANLNLLLDTHQRDTITGTAALNGAPVTLGRAVNADRDE
jgi:anaerobic selenocysteine-containing dehydrogenase